LKRKMNDSFIERSHAQSDFNRIRECSMYSFPLCGIAIVELVREQD
jgi:hypothetical protein